MRRIKNYSRVSTVLAAGLSLGLLAPALTMNISCTTPAKDKAGNYDPEISSFLAGNTQAMGAASANLSLTSGGYAYLQGTFGQTGGTAVLTPGNIAVTSGVPVKVGPMAATTTYVLTVTDGKGLTTSKLATVTVYPAPDATITIPAAVITGKTGLTASVASIPGSTYQWTVPSGGNAIITAGATTSTVTFTAGNAGAAGAAATMTLSCSVKNIAGASDTKTITIPVTANPPVGLSYPSSSYTWYASAPITTLVPAISGGDKVQAFTVVPALPAGLVLDPLLGTISGTPTTATAKATYHVAAQNSGGAAGFDLSLTINAKPDALMSASSAKIGVGGGATLSWSVGSTVASITVDNGVQATPLDTTTVKAGTFNVHPTATTTYVLTCTLVGGGTFVVPGITITVDAAPFVINTLTADAANNVVPYGGSTNLRWTLTGTPVDLTLNGTSVLGNSSTTINPARRSNYTLRGDNGVGLTNVSTKSITIAAQGLDLLAGNFSGPAYKDGAAKSALISGAYGLATDAAGNVYIADTNANVIRMMDTAGNITTIAGVAGAVGKTDSATGTPLFDQPRGIVSTTDGKTLYVSDYNQHTVRKLVKTGTTWTVSTIAGVPGTYGTADGATGTAQLDNPWGMCFDPEDASQRYLYVADYYTSRIRQIDTTTGITLNYAGSAFGHADVSNTYLGLAKFDNPIALTFGKVGGQKVIFVLCYYTNGVEAITYSGPATVGATTSTGMTGSVTTLCGVAAPTTSGSYGFLDGVGTAAKLNNPMAMIADASGNLYVADSLNNAVRKVTVNSLAAGTATVSTIVGTFTTAAGVNITASGSQDGNGLAAGLNSPRGIAIKGNSLIVSDFTNATLRAVDLSTAANATTTIAGTARVQGYANATGALAKFNAPTGVDTDASGNAYIADTANHIIRKVDKAGAVTLLAGTPSISGAVDSAAGTPAFKSPQGVAVDHVNNIVYVADTGNKSIRKIVADGTVSTVLTGLAGPTGIMVDLVNPAILWVTDSAGSSATSKNNVLQVTVTGGAGAITLTAGGAGYAWADGAVATARFKFNAFAGIAGNAAGDIFVADPGNNVIRKLTKASGYTVSTIAGVATTPGYIDTPGTPTFSGPQGLAIDAAGNLYIAEYTNNSIRKLATDGTVTTLVGGSSTQYNAAGAPTVLGTVTGILPAGLMQPKALALLPNADGSVIDLLVVTVDAVMQVTAATGK